MWESLKRVWPLLVVQGLFFSGVTQAVFSATLTGKSLAGASYATLPVALLPVGTALGVLPVVSAMSRYGRRRVMISAVIILALCNVVAGLSIRYHLFPLFCISFLLMGAAISAVAQLRFAAMEKVPEHLHAGATSCVLLGGIAAAYIGPELGLFGSHLTEFTFEGSHYIVACAIILATLFLWPVSTQPTRATHNQEVSYATLLKRFPYITAMSCAAMSYALMSYIMTATPISMHEHHQHSLEDTKSVIQAHILAMFLPSLFTQYVVTRLTLLGMIITGLGLFALCLLIGYCNADLLGFYGALILLGVAWNFMYVGATALLPQTYHESERFKAQGLNDFLVFGTQACAALSAGVILNHVGWQGLLLTAIPFILVQGVVLAVFKYRADT